MREFMLLIRNEGDPKASFTPERQRQFLKACEAYIGELKSGGKLLSAQPLMRDGRMISGTPAAFCDSAYAEGTEIIVGYYHIRANDLAEAIAIAKGNPEFAFHAKAKVEVRPIKTVEPSTSYVYSTESAPQR